MYCTKLTINGEVHELEADVRTSLLDALREHLGLTGAKKGCDHGQCGACTVLINGRRINSCLTLAVMHDGDEITTIEGLGTAEKMSPLQRAFISHDGFQCGYCTSGQICAATALLDELRDGWPSYVSQHLGDVDLQGGEISLREISERLSGNICRCSCYPNIVEAVRKIVGDQP